jgi:predicted dinucleotide-binding enzyme
MNIAIIGTGNIGGNLANAWKSKHTIIFGVRDSAKEVEGIRAVPVAEAATNAEVVVLAIPFKAAEGVITQLGDLTNKLIIDCTNAVGATLTQPSAAQVIQMAAKGAHVVKAFNTQGAETIEQPRFGDTAATVFYCGDDAGAKQSAKQLISDAGFDAIDVGGLDQAKYVEAATFLWFAASKQLGTRRLAFKLLRDA